MRNAVAVVLLLGLSAPAYAWNNTGHMVAARIAWLKLEPGQRAKATKILQGHPHYDEFLSADRPKGFTEEEWVFLRAATWPDWVRNHYTKEYHKKTWHYINYPFVLPDAKIAAKDQEIPPDQQNIVRQLAFVTKMVKMGVAENRAVYLCWVLHLTGDIHQPLHTAALFSREFPEGDAGGNLAHVVLHDGARTTQLHPMWDRLLGTSTKAAAINKIVAEVDSMVAANPGLIQSDLEKHTSVESWAKESFAVAKKMAYLDGQLPVGVADDETDDIAVAPDDYARNAGRTARVQIAKAGARLAATLANVVD